MKKRLTHNIGLKLLSLVIAIVIWFVVVNIEDPLERKTFYGVSVSLLNQKEVTEREKIIEVVKGDVIDVTVEGKRSDLEKIKAKDFRATADLTDISKWDTVMIQITLPEYPDVKVINNAQNVIKLMFDDYVTRRFSFRINTTGNAATNYVIGDAFASPNMIQISGAKTVLDKIKEVVLDIDANGKNSDFTSTAVPFVYDLNGELIDSSKLSMNIKSVSVTVPVLPTKKLKVRVETTGVLPEGYEILSENIAFQPETVRIAGTKEELDSLSPYLTIADDVTGKTETIEKNINVIELLDDSLSSLHVVDNSVIAITVQVTPFVEKPIDIPVSRLEIRDLSEHLTHSILQSNLILRVRCRSARAAFLSAESVDPYVNLQGLTEGTYHLELQYDLPVGVLKGQPTYVDVTLSPKEASE